MHMQAFFVQHTDFITVWNIAIFLTMPSPFSKQQTEDPAQGTGGQQKKKLS